MQGAQKAFRYGQQSLKAFVADDKAARQLAQTPYNSEVMGAIRDFFFPQVTAVRVDKPLDVQAANQSAAGKYNQQVYNRNAQIAELEREQLEKQNEVDLQIFQQKFDKLQSETKTKILTSGVELSGSGLRVLHNNDIQAQVEKNRITYNSKVAQQSKFNEANFARIQGGVARQTGKAAAIGTLASAAFSFGQSKPGQTLLGNIPNPFA